MKTKNAFNTTYISILMIDAVISLLLVTGYYVFYPKISDSVITFSALIELFLCLFSIIFIIYILIKRQEKIQLVLPIFFLIFFVGGYIDSHIIMAQGVNVMDLRNVHNVISTIVELGAYVFILIFGWHLLKRNK